MWRTRPSVCVIAEGYIKPVTLHTFSYSLDQWTLKEGTRYKVAVLEILLTMASYVARWDPWGSLYLKNGSPVHWTQTKKTLETSHLRGHPHTVMSPPGNSLSHFWDRFVIMYRTPWVAWTKAPGLTFPSVTLPLSLPYKKAALLGSGPPLSTPVLFEDAIHDWQMVNCAGPPQDSMSLRG